MISSHARDLRVIAFLVIYFALWFAVIAIVLALWKEFFSKEFWHMVKRPNGFAWWMPVVGFINGVAIAIPVIGAVWSLVLAVLAWAYRSGNERLGVVDLFACEIITLCRVCTVTRLTNGCIEAYRNADSLQRFAQFVSQETYTNVFDKNSKDLEALEADVIGSVTAFYTYWKAMRDAFRRLAVIDVREDKAAWQHTMLNVIYMQFLAFESGRSAVEQLVFKLSNRTRDSITILLSEMPAHAFLLNSLERGDVRRERLASRKTTLLTTARSIVDLTETHYGRRPRDWDAANTLLAALRVEIEVLEQLET